MKKYGITSFFVSFIFACAAFPITAFANSSWHWLTDARPIYILPVVAVATVLIEAFMIIKCAKVTKKVKAAAGVIAANMLSFAFPYVLRCFDELYSFEEMINSTPSFTVGLSFLLMTLVVEIPVVYAILHKDAPNRYALIKAILLSNTITTIMVAVIERIICRGAW